MGRIVSVMLVLCLSTAALLSNDTPRTKQVIAVRSHEQIRVDGVLSEGVWQRVGFSDLEQREPDQGAAPTEKTEVWIAYDNEALYLAAKMYDRAPDSIVARLVRRDFVYGDPSDGFVFYLDPYRDKMTGFLFYVSAAGTVADGVVENDGRFELSWDGVWEGVSRMHSDGYAIEMKIPFSQLRFNEAPIQIWGVNFERYIGRKNETDLIVYTPRNESGFVSRFPELVGIEGITPTSRLEAMPYVTGRAEYVGNDPGDPFNPGQKYLPNTGVDLKVGLGSSLTLDGTVNPDFGQVEVDPAVVNLTDVETSFQEKRPFFTEGVSIFRFGEGGSNNNWSFNWSTPNLFYSRRIGRTPRGALPEFDYADIPSGTRILGAGKISGRILGDWKLGTIHAVTKREFAQIDRGGQRARVELEPLSYYGVLRMQKDFDAGQQGVGILSTTTSRFFDNPTLRDQINSNAMVMAADGWSYLDNDRTYVLTGWAGLSHVRGNESRMIALQQSSAHYFQRPDISHVSLDSSATSLTGYAGRLMLNKQRGQFTFNTAVGVIDPHFEINDLGYSSYSDVINSHLVAGYRWNEPTEYYRYVVINGATYLSYDFGGNKTGHGYWLGTEMMLPNYYMFSITGTYTPPSLNARRTRGGPLTLNPVGHRYSLDLYTDNRVWWVLNLGGNTEAGDYGEFHSLYSNLEMKISPSLTVSVGPGFSREINQAQWVTAYTDPTAQETFGKRYIFAHLDQTTVSANIRLNCILSPRLSFQVYLQPLVSSGNYSDFKELTRAKSFDFRTYGYDGSALTEETSPTGDRLYTLAPDRSGTGNGVTIANPDFSYRSLRGIAVLRWEYAPGSTLYFVWTQSRSAVEPVGDFHFGRSINDLLGVNPDNIFMIKASYWWGM